MKTKSKRKVAKFLHKLVNLNWKNYGSVLLLFMQMNAKLEMMAVFTWRTESKITKGAIPPYNDVDVEMNGIRAKGCKFISRGNWPSLE